MALSFKQSLAYFWEQIGKQFLKNGKDVDYEVLLPKTTLEPNDGSFIIPDTIGVPVGGQEYTVVYNGETYYCTAQNGASTDTGHICVIGDASKLNVEGMPAGDKGVPFLIALAIEDSSNTITESIFQAWDNATSVTLEILVDAGPVYLTKDPNNEIMWIEREFYDLGNTITEVIKNGYLESDMDGTYLRGDFVGAITAGHVYIVHTDNGDYECKAWKIPEDVIQNIDNAQLQDIYRNYVVLGSSDATMIFFPTMDGVNIDTDIPFTLAFVPSGLFGDETLALVNCDSDFTTNNLTIDEKSAKIKKLDPKYIHTPDWNAGENEPGYIANKTHGYEYSENALLASVGVDMSEEEVLAYLGKPLGLTAEEKYTVIIDDTTYEATASTTTLEGLTITYLGDLAALEDLSTASVPFCIAELPTPMDGVYWQPVAEIQTLLEIRGPGKTIKKLSDEFINWPDWLPQIAEVDTTVYYDVTGYSWTQLDNGRYMIEALSDPAQLLAIDWEEGTFYTTQFNNNDLRLHCIYEPGSYDIPECYILCEPQYTDMFSAINSSRVAFIIFITYNKVSVYAQDSLSRVVIKNKAKYIKQISPYAIQELPWSLTNGTGPNSLISRNLVNVASGKNSIALGYHSNASAPNSFVWNGAMDPVEKQDNAFTVSVAGSAEASGRGSISLSGQSEGRRSFAVQGGYAKGEHSIALGNTRAYGTNQTTIGVYNNTDTENKYSLIVGNGTGWGESDGVLQQSNAFTINWDGKVWAKDLYMNGTEESDASHVATEAYVNGLIVPSVLESTTEKENAAGPIGKYASGTPGMNSFTWGIEALAAGGGSIAMGTSSTTSSSAHWGVALGTYAASKSDGAIAIGQNVTASNTNAVAIGAGATASSLRSVAIGNNLTANYNDQVVLGTYNVSGNYSLLLGNGSGSARSNAFGVTNTGTGYFAGDLYVNGTGTSSTFSNAKKVATESYVDTKVAGLVDSAPDTLNTLNELATALGDDPNFATTVATEIGKKADKTDLVALTEAEILEVCVIN